MEQSPPYPQGARERSRLRMAQPEQGAAAFLLPPFDVVLEIVRRLPAKSVIRLRAVSKAWRDVTSRADFVATLHRLQPPQPLLCSGLVACPHRYIQLRDYCVGALDLRSDKLRSIFRFTDNKYFGYDDIAHADDLDYGREVNDESKLQFSLTIHASLDGLLLVSFVNDWYVCNPATRQWAALPELDCCDVVGFYRHRPSGEYRVLYHTGQEDADASTCYYVLTVGSQVARSIGCPISPAATVNMGSALGVGLDPSSLCPPVQLLSKLHWPPQDRQGYHILVFDTEAEVFSRMVPPVRKKEPTMEHLVMTLLDMEDRLGMSVSRIDRAALELWLLEDYHNSVWTMLYLIKLPVLQMTSLQNEGWFPSVVSPEGDVVIVCHDRVLHCDRHGKVLQSFCFPEKTRLVPVRHRLKESLLPHAMFLAPRGDDAVEPPFFRGL